MAYTGKILKEDSSILLKEDGYALLTEAAVLLIMRGWAQK